MNNENMQHKAATLCSIVRVQPLPVNCCTCKYYNFGFGTACVCAECNENYSQHKFD